MIEEEFRKLGPITRPELKVMVVFFLTAILWITRPLLNDHLPGLSDTGIAVMAGLLLFLLPSGRGGGRILNWNSTKELPWGILLLFGGGLSLANAIQSTGLAARIGEGVSGYEGTPSWLIIMAIIACIVFLTSIMSNTATSATFLPILASAAAGLGLQPYMLLAPAAMGASCAFMLPVSTPPNAIVYSSERISIARMSRAGFWMNLIAILLIMGVTYSVLLWVFGMGTGGWR